MRNFVVVSLAALPALIATCVGSDQTTSAPPREPEIGIEAVTGRGPVLGIAEPNSWRRVPPLAGTDETARLIDEVGADSHRFVVDWGVVEPQPPEGGHRYDFAAFDAMYRADLRRGIRPLLIVLSAPPWASDVGTLPGGASHNPPAPSRLGDWAAFVGAVARRYPRALGIEVWNEPNLAGFWGRASALTRPDPERYASLLRASYDAIKSANPRLFVVGGALAPGRSGVGSIPAPDFLRGVLEAGGGAYMDALSLHPYPGGAGVPQTLALIDEVRRVRDELGARMPLWLTEVGVTTSGPYAASEAEQAKTLADLCRAAVVEPDVDALYIHTLIERPGPVTSPEPGFGLVEPLAGGELRPKPAFRSVRRVFSRDCATSN